MAACDDRCVSEADKVLNFALVLDVGARNMLSHICWRVIPTQRDAVALDIVFYGAVEAPVIGTASLRVDHLHGELFVLRTHVNVGQY